MKRIRLLSVLAITLLIAAACESSPSAPAATDPSAPVFDGGSGGAPTDSAKMGHGNGSGG